MTELVLKGRISQKKLDSIINFLKSWDIDVEVKATAATKKADENPFAESFGMWADRDIDIKAIRQKNREQRTKAYDDGSL